MKVFKFSLIDLTLSISLFVYCDKKQIIVIPAKLDAAIGATRSLFV
jgi:hypothetical protein